MDEEKVKMVTEEGQKASEVARSLGIYTNVLYNWKRKYSQDGDKAFIGKGHLSEIVVLRRKLRKAEPELEILKKQSSYSQNRQRTLQVCRFHVFLPVPAQSNMPGAGGI